MCFPSQSPGTSVLQGQLSLPEMQTRCFNLVEKVLSTLCWMEWSVHENEHRFFLTGSSYVPDITITINSDKDASADFTRAISSSKNTKLTASDLVEKVVSRQSAWEQTCCHPRNEFRHGCILCQCNFKIINQRCVNMMQHSDKESWKLPSICTNEGTVGGISGRDATYQELLFIVLSHQCSTSALTNLIRFHENILPLIGSGV